MATVAGFFFGKNSMVYAAGAPRSNGTGQVILFTKKINVETLLFSKDKKLVISGEQLASNFGYELASADLNGDKWVTVLNEYFVKNTLSCNCLSESVNKHKIYMNSTLTLRYIKSIILNNYGFSFNIGFLMILSFKKIKI